MMKPLIPTIFSVFSILAPLGASDSYDGFVYAGGTSIIGQDGGSGWTGAWSATGGKGDGVSPTATATSLGYQDSRRNLLLASGGRMALNQSNDLAYMPSGAIPLPSIQAPASRPSPRRGSGLIWFGTGLPTIGQIH